jgi:biotin carboxyl carrier protein
MKLVYLLNNQSYSLTADRAGDGFEIDLNGELRRIQVIAVAPPRITFLYQEKIVTARVVRDGKRRWIHIDGTTFVVEREDATTRRTHTQGMREGRGSGLVIAPMPGQVRAVLVSEGNLVSEGQPVLLLEAMKMEIRVNAPHAGRVASLTVKQGDRVEREQVLVEISEE